MQPGLFKASDDMQTVTKRKEQKEKKKKTLFTLPSGPGRFSSLYYPGVHMLIMPVHKVYDVLLRCIIFNLKHVPVRKIM
jgi:hypothetical protein